MVAIFNIRFFSLFFVFGIIPTFAFGQVGNWNFEHFSYKDGLASNEIFNMIQDSDGYIWIATSEGLNRYNGSTFKQYKPDPLDSHSISDGEIVGIKESPDFIWMGSNGGILNKYDKHKGEFQSYPIKHKGQKWNHVIWDIELEGDSILWLVMERGVVKFNINSGESHVFLPTETNQEIKDIMYNVFYSMENNFSNKDELLVAGRGGLLIFNKKTQSFTINKLYNKKQVVRDIYLEGDSLIWLSGVASLVKINILNNSHHIYPVRDKLNTAIISNFIRKISSNEYWIGFFEQGPAIFNKESEQFSFMIDLPEIYREFPKNNCISYLRSKDGSLWFGTDKGIYVLTEKSRKIRHYHIPKPESKYALYHFIHDIIEFKREEAYLVIPTISQLPILIDRKTGKTIRTSRLSKEVKKKVGAIDFRKVIEDSDGKIWLTSTRGLYQLNKENFEIEFPELSTQYDFTKHDFFYILNDKSGNIFLSCHNPNGLVQINAARDEVISYFKFFEDNSIVSISDLDISKNGKVILFSSPFVSSFDLNTASFSLLTCPKNPDLVSMGWIRCGFVDEDKLWLGYQGNGISLIHDWENDCTIRNFKKSDGLHSNSIYEFEVADDGNIWTATGNGISIIDPETMESVNISQKDGLLTNNTGIYWASSLKYLDNGEMFLGGHSFFTIFHTDSILNHDKEEFNPVFEEFLVFGKEKKLHSLLNNNESIKLKHDENFFTINFANLNYNQVAPTKYKYKLEPYDKSWITTFSNKAQYKKVPPGEYCFVLSHANKHISSKERSFIIKIVPAWWQTNLFKIIVALFILAFTLFFINLRTSYIRKKEKVKASYDKKLLETEMKMLQSQLNSHFLFNSLNSIKNYIIKNETSLAASYLSNFAQLIRIVLNNSQNKSIPLSSELEALELYISLEALRFNDKFDYKIEVKDGIDKEKVKVPPLLLQPFVENAIWHGLLHQDKKGKIDILIQTSTNNIQYCITDNGVGRKKAHELKSKSAIHKKTFGLKLSSERLDTIRKMYDLDISLEIVDLFDKGGKPCGTKVSISFPSHKVLK